VRPDDLYCAVRRQLETRFALNLIHIRPAFGAAQNQRRAEPKGSVTKEISLIIDHSWKWVVPDHSGTMDCHVLRPEPDR
jgi:hypothetical protein